jgi:hypothetical protein
VAAHVEQLIGIYNAEGTLRGELAYFVGKRLGRSHCALCDITHGLVATKPAWQHCRMSLPVRFETVHLDERDDDLVSLTDGRTPCVVADVDGRREILLGPDDLEACHGSPDALVAAIGRATDERGWILARP